MTKIISQIKNFIKDTDKFLLFLCVALSAFGILLVSSATHSADTLFSRDAKVMLLAVSAGILMALVISVIDYNFIVRLWPVIGIVCLLFMFLLMIPGVGVGPSERSDVKTWIKVAQLGSSVLYFQPSELVKIGFIITFSVHLDTVSDNINAIKNVLLLCIHGAVPVILVIVTGDMGSALIFLIIFVVMLFSAGVSLKYFLLGGIFVAAAVPLMWNFVMTSIQKDRILALIEPDKYPDIIYQQEMGLKAIRNGGMFGMGVFNGTYTQSATASVPENENDMIFSVIGEEFGLVGCILTLIVFVVIVIRIVSIGKNSRDNTVTLICSGVASMVAAQVMVNIGMCLELMPVIGITLPFLSAGGSSNLCIYIAVGLILSLRRHTLERDIVNFRYKNISTPFD
ncbi:MAG: FtsW/RodA/SpoVE family cell cycle protein [Clostridia bacterium]|nr:FtsW/RodA/SpoVE family cell cycle protein [Clostridia bacterium]